MKRKDYPVGYIRKLFANYSELAEGRWPFRDDGMPTKKHSFRSPYENAIIAKADLDKAIDSLSHIEREVVTKINIEGYLLEDLGIENAWRIEKRAIRNMAAYLNGECILERWCKENGLLEHDVQDYLTKEIQQYVKDICRNYCVLDECPE